MWNFRYYAHCIELNCNFTIWLKVTVNSPFRWINLGSTSVTGGVTQSNKADKRSQRQAVTAFYILIALSIPCFAPHSCHMNALLVSHHIASSAISAVASYNGFVWLTLSIHA